MIFYEVFRRGRRYGASNLHNYGTLGKKIIETDSRERAERAFEREITKARIGNVTLLADGFLERHYRAYWNITRW